MVNGTATANDLHKFIYAKQDIPGGPKPYFN